MNILFISNWGIRDGLTGSTVIPHIKILSEYEEIKKIILITIERDQPVVTVTAGKIKHFPIHSRFLLFPFLEKSFNFVRIPKILSGLIRLEKIDNMIARGAPAGALAYLTWKIIKIPFFVESFEPHAEYMLESGVWKKWSLKYLFQKKWESKIKKHASGLITVSNNYKNRLLSEGISDIPVEMAACSVNQEDFKFNQQARIRIREKYNISENTMTGIYVGKFGDIYYEAEAYKLFKNTFDFFNGDFFLIIISTDLEPSIKKNLEVAGFPADKVFYHSAEHHEVPDYLSASDFGFAPIRQASSRLYCSPVKIGEYWANGLPVLLTKGVGDENDFIESEKGGILFEIDDPLPALEKLKTLLNEPGLRKTIPDLAAKYRSFNSTRKIYEKLILKKNP